MSTPSPIALNIANAQSSTGPRTEEGKAISSQNAIKTGLFTASDFVRPGEESLYAEMDETLDSEISPAGILERNLVGEILGAMWRLRRCGLIEASFAAQLAIGSESIGSMQNDPMQNESTARLQLSVDRARAQCHRILHRCTAELRKLQTERRFRNESFEAGTDISIYGLADMRSVAKTLSEQASALLRQNKACRKEELAILEDGYRGAPAFATAETPVAKRTQTPPQTPRNAPCSCGSGRKYKRCCGQNAPPVLHAA